jgi:large-conductance mechanosensitive channel
MKVPLIKVSITFPRYAKRKREKEAEAEKPAIVEEPKDLELLSEIRDLLRKS